MKNKSAECGVRSAEMMRKILLAGVTAAVLFWSYAIVMGSDWSNPQPQSVDDKAGQLLLKCCGTMDAGVTSVVEDLYNSGTGKLNLLKSNHAGAAAPSGPNTGQSWYDTTNKLFKIYDGTWGGGGIYSSGTFSWSGPIITSGTATHNGTETFTGATSITSTTTLSGATTISGNVVTSGINTHSGTETFTGATSLTSTTTLSGPTTISSVAISSSSTTAEVTNLRAASATGLIMSEETFTTQNTTSKTFDNPLGTFPAGSRIYTSFSLYIANSGSGCNGNFSISVSQVGSASVTFYPACQHSHYYPDSTVIPVEVDAHCVIKVNTEGTVTLRGSVANYNCSYTNLLSFYTFLLK